MIIGIASADYLRKSRSPDGAPKWGGAGWARIGQYLPYLRASGHTVVCGTLWRENGQMVIEDDIEDRTERVTPDVVILQRLMHEGIAQDCINSRREHGQFFIQDIDDWYWGLDPRNQAWMASHPKYNKEENTRFYTANVAAADMITVSTPWLADACAKKWPGKQIEVIKNYVDVARFTPVIGNPYENPTLGWVGSTAHRSGDLEILKGTMNQAINLGYTIYHGGHNPQADSFASRVGLTDEQTVVKPLTTAEQYPMLLTMDVGVIPLSDKPFNHAKSDIKGLEYAASGIPFIASPSPSYTTLHKEFDGHFLLAKRPRDWIKGYKHYFLDDNRFEDSQALLDLVKQRDIQYGARHLLEVIEGVK